MQEEPVHRTHPRRRFQCPLCERLCSSLLGPSLWKRLERSLRLPHQSLVTQSREMRLLSRKRVARKRQKIERLLAFPTRIREEANHLRPQRRRRQGATDHLPRSAARSLLERSRVPHRRGESAHSSQLGPQETSLPQLQQIRTSLRKVKNPLPPLT